LCSPIRNTGDRGGEFIFVASSGAEVESPDPSRGTTFSVTANVDAVEVLVDGRRVGETPLSDAAVTPGRHRISIEKEGYEPYRKRIRIDRGHAVSLFVDLSETGPVKARLYVETTPEDARVRILNIGPVFRQGMDLDPGRYHVEVSAEGYEPDRRWVTLSSREDENIDVRLDRVKVAVPAPAGTRGVSKNQIVVGTHTALSGPVAGWGIDATNGVRMRFDEANEAGGIYGRKIKYIVEDSQYRVPIAVQKANKLVNRDKAFFLIASIGTPMNNAIFPMLKKKNVPNLFPFTAARSMYEPLSKLKFANLAPYYGNVRAGLKCFVEEKGKERVCIMYQDTDFGLETAEAVTDQLKEMNMTLVAERQERR